MSQNKTENKKNESTDSKKFPLNLPDTAFPMRGNLPQREPGWIEQWNQNDVYGKIRSARKGEKRFLLHDGPPYANGNIHVGHAINKVLKDIILKSKTLEGYDAPYTPGWDCHGMPIEIQIEKKYGKNLPKEEVMAKCRAYAKEQVKSQMASFQRLGVLADWKDPYLTMRHETEAEEIRAFGIIMEKGFVYRGLKPVNWCFDCQSALAEAEVEYKDHTSPTIDVAFPISEEDKPQLEKIFSVETDKPIATVIWTTTPWTIPSNQALNMNPDLDYVLVDTSKRMYVLAEGLYEDSLKRFGLEGKVLAKANGKAFKKIRFKHPLANLDPFYNRFSAVFLASYVDATAGTGIVHAAPAYGVEDYISCKANGITNEEIINPVQADGFFAESLPLFGGLNVWKAKNKIIGALELSGNLLSHGEITHSYMHCWRHKTPLIYRATNQWFIRMDEPDADSAGVIKGHEPKQTLRQIALEGINNTTFIPTWGKQRLHNMIAGRPDWCISRQRNWGVPLPFLIHKETGKLHPDTMGILAKVADLVEKEGIEAWSRLKVSDLITQDVDKYVKSTDTLDVWFDSGTTHMTVMRGSHADKQGYPIDLYLEGSDQHRGWFHSSLLTGSAIDGRPPYKALLTHGFTVDEQGRKMSKSLGNVIAPSEITDTYGAEIIRLWVASSDYTAEISLSKGILKGVVESYRRFRNTIRFLLANTSDFDIKKDAVSLDKLVELDRWAVARTQQLKEEILDKYDRYEFHTACSSLMLFMTDDLGGFYLDILKDRLYTNAADSESRRSAQTALWYITNCVLRLLAPILSFTAEEAWSVFNPESQGTIFVEKFEDLPSIKESVELLNKWAIIRSIRSDVQKEIETLREKGQLGSSLQAEVSLRLPQDEYDIVKALEDEISYVMITSEAKLVGVSEKREISVSVSGFKKCERCWQYKPDVGTDSTYKTLCCRCIGNLFGSPEKRKFA